MSDPRFLTIFAGLFVLLGVYNIFLGLKRIRETRAQGQRIVWYQQINLLTGIEYVLLALVFLMSLSIRNGTLPSDLKAVVIPIYLIVLLSSAVLAGLVIRQGILNTRRRSSSLQPQASTNGRVSGAKGTADETLTPEQRATSIQQRRERRKKAAAARRRRAGKA